MSNIILETLAPSKLGECKCISEQFSGIELYLSDDQTELGYRYPRDGYEWHSMGSADDKKNIDYVTNIMNQIARDEENNVDEYDRAYTIDTWYKQNCIKVPIADIISEYANTLNPDDNISCAAEKNRLAVIADAIKHTDTVGNSLPFTKAMTLRESLGMCPYGESCRFMASCKDENGEPDVTKCANCKSYQQMLAEIS